MSCSGCYSSFSLLRPEKGCPLCGFSFCSKCLGSKVFIPKINAEHKVCNKCKKASMSTNSGKKNEYIPPDVFYKRMDDGSKQQEQDNENPASSNIDEQMRERLNKLKEKDTNQDKKQATEAEIAARLQKIKGDMPITSDAELHARLAKLRGIPVIESKPVLLTKDLRTEQEQVEDLMKQYLENTAIDCKYKDEFDSVINVMEARLQKLKGAKDEASGSSVPQNVPQEIQSEDEEESVMKIVEKLKAEAFKEEDEIAPSTNDELPFCEICNEDAKMRCLGCRYLFCKRCFLDHKDDDDGCDKYELYQPSKVLLTKDLRTEQEQVEDLMKQYLENTAIDCKYKDEFDSVINVMEARLQKLKGAKDEASGSSVPQNVPQEIQSEDEEESVMKIVEKLKAEAFKEEDEIAPSTNDELPFCEICNEDAKMRCLGCRYLFCKRCFLDHKDDDDGCDKYELYQPSKGTL